MKMKTLKKQAGATLLEVLAFLGIAALILIGAIAMFRSAQGSAQSNDLITQIAGLRGNIKTLSASQASYGTATFPATGTAFTQGMNQTLIAAKAVPDTLRYQNATPWNITNSFNGLVQVDGSASEFWIVYTNVPQEVCVKVAPQTGASWLGLRINANAETPTDTAVFPVATATTQCVAGATNTMVWRGR